MSTPFLASPFHALSLALRIGSVGCAISSLELLSRRAEMGPGGAFDATVEITRSTRLSRFKRLADPRVAIVLVVLRLLGSLSLIAAAGSFETARAGALVVAATTLALRARSRLEIHASGAMVMMVFTASALGLAVGTRRSMECALAFIAGQSLLSYFIAGSSKLQTRSWRGGQALALIMSTSMWGNRREAVLLKSHPRLGWVLCWLTMLGECSVPLSLIVPLPVTVGLLAVALAFHVAVAIEMGLNSFVWAYGSTYPAVIFCWYWLHGFKA
jgi:hypothetical protein